MVIRNNTRWEIDQTLMDMYVNAFMNGDKRVYQEVEAHGVLMFKGFYGTVPLPVWETLLPLFRIREMARYEPSAPIAVTALMNPNCPVHILALAAIHPLREYHIIARANPSCPAEYEVFAALWTASHV